MTRFFALHSVVFMMAFVIVFDRNHWRKKIHRFLSVNLFSQEEMSHLLAIWSECQEPTSNG